jgi:uncharacterized repeat protein (TIGR04138 family)
LPPDAPVPAPAPAPGSDRDAVEEVLEKDARYKREAYHFVMAGLQYTVEHLGARRHVSGQELLKGIRNLACERFGMMAPTVFRAWGITETRDFGQIVFNLVEAKVLSRRPEDSLDDFRDGFDFATAFEPEYDLEPPANDRS